MTTDVRAMAAVCARWPRCAGFTSDGRLFASVDPASRVRRTGGCGGRSAYERIRGYDLCTADTCNDFAPPSAQAHPHSQAHARTHAHTHMHTHAPASWPLVAFAFRIRVFLVFMCA